MVSRGFRLVVSVWQIQEVLRAMSLKVCTSIWRVGVFDVAIKWDVGTQVEKKKKD